MHGARAPAARQDPGGHGAGSGGARGGWRPKGRVCLITGGGPGIGWALASRLAQAGAEVFVADNSVRHLAQARTEAASTPGGTRIRLADVDVSDQAAVQSWTGAILQDKGRIDVLVNNAAYTRWDTLERTRTSDDLLTMRTAFDAAVFTVKAVLPSMRAANSGHIVNIGSCVSRLPSPGPSASYVAAKAAVEAFTRMLRLELDGTAIHVTLVRPGPVAGTDFFAEQVPSARMPRLADFVPPLNPTQVAVAITRALAKPVPTLDIPRCLPALYALHPLLPPGLLHRLARLGGAARCDYAQPHPPRTAPRPLRKPQP